MATQIQLRRDSSADWLVENPILAQAEVGIEIDTNYFKIGDGLTTWSGLDYFTGDGVTDHGNLLGLDDPADHAWASLINGTRAFTGTVSGVAPTEDAHLTRKDYVDNLVTTTSGDIVTGYTDADAVVTTNYITADTTLSGEIYTGYTAADAVVTAAYIAADTTLSGDLVTGYTAADTVVTNAYIAADTTLSGILNDKITTLNDTVANYGMLVIDAADMVPATTSGSLAGTYEYSTNKIDFDYFAFGGGITKERVLFKLSMPENWDRGTIKAKFHWSSATGSTAGDTVEWALKSGALSDSDAIDDALGTPQVISDALLADNGADLQITSTTPAITVGGSPTLGDMLVFEVYRNTDGTDDMAEDSWLFGVRIQYKIDNSVVVW